MADAEGGSEQDDVSFLRTVSIFKKIIHKLNNTKIVECFVNRKTWYVFRVPQQESVFA